MPKNKLCKIRRWAVIAANRVDISYGFRCSTHGILTKRYSTEQLCLDRITEHIAEHKKGAKKS